MLHNSRCFDKCIMTCIYHYSITQNSFTVLKMPSAPPIYTWLQLFLRSIMLIRGVVVYPFSTVGKIPSLYSKEANWDYRLCSLSLSDNSVGHLQFLCFGKSYYLSVMLNTKVNFTGMMPCLFRICCDI